MQPKQKPEYAPNNGAALDPIIRRDTQALVNEVGKVIVGKRRVLELVTVAMLTEGAHVLFEDLPGLGKSVMVAAFARASGTKFNRVQFTPDLLPSDITGTYVLDQKKGAFDFNEGPIFTNFLLADEINRASPKTQSALLEAMAEKQVTVEGTTHKLPRPFIVMATQNPIEQEGTYPLPEAQLDRFMIKASVGHPDRNEEREILRRRNERQKDDFDVQPVTSVTQVQNLQKAVERIEVHGSLLDYIAGLVTSTREHPSVLVGASPRGSLALLKLAKSQAAFNNRGFVVPDDITALVNPVLGHRIILRPGPRIQGVKPADVLREILKSVPVPKI